MPTYKFVYFNGRARGEAIRMAFAVGGVKFEDVRVELSDWPTLKPKTPQGALPTLEVNGKTLSQSMAILRYVGRECGLIGKKPIEQAEVDCLIETLTDIWNSHVNFVREQDLTIKKKLLTKHTDEVLPKVMDLMEKALADNSAGKGFLVGSGLTIADIRLYCTMDYPLEAYGFKLDKYPKVAAHRKMMEAIPKIADYLKKRPKDEILPKFLLPVLEKCRS
ncbi:hypothetical protein ScPMuIL_004197 [Solemya velum]